ncbi:hypothetical protein PHMEG_00013940 [Phytophthora megakarya]|uniref:Uncharacterized protein n=1 Tax=Phytophthora megakarya TaxID=4795 RepID=A0A225W507_9STRA|nr:hypothetical protein PHMEG_00013940 [Phytophthora megakarya]
MKRQLLSSRGSNGQCTEYEECIGMYTISTTKHGCSAHVLNRLMQDVCRLPAIRAIQTRAVALM